MEQVLSLSARPVSLDGLVGQQESVASIRRRWEKQRMPKAWLFHGPLGCGKTTIARILALALQCQHQEVFGKPCAECRRLKSQFQIFEFAAGDAGADKLKELLAPSFLSPMGASTYRIFILDEPQGMSTAAQRALLKVLEDTPKTTIFMLCTTEPHRLVDTVRSRCAAYELRGLDSDEMLVLITRLLKKLDSDLPADRLTDALVDKGIWYPRWIAQAVERYVSDGGELAAACNVDAAQTVDTKALVKAMTKGDWPAAITYLLKAQTTDARPIRLGVLGYLKGILLNDENIADRVRIVSDAIMDMIAVQNAEDIVVMSAVCAVVYRVCEKFSRYKR